MAVIIEDEQVDRLLDEVAALSGKDRVRTVLDPLGKEAKRLRDMEEKSRLIDEISLAACAKAKNSGVRNEDIVAYDKFGIPI